MTRERLVPLLLLTIVLAIFGLVGCSKTDPIMECEFDIGDDVYVKTENAKYEAKVHRVTIDETWTGVKYCLYLVSFNNPKIHPDIAWVAERYVWWRYAAKDK